MNYKMLIAGIFCISLLLFGVYKLGEIKGSDQKASSVFKSAYIAPTISPISTQSATPIPTATTSPLLSASPVITPPISELEQKWKQLKKDYIKNGAIFRKASENSAFNAKEFVEFDSGLVLTLERFTTSMNEGYSSVGNYYVKIDLSILNLSAKTYLIDRNSFTLSDALGFSYPPSNGYNSRGDLSGELQKDDMKRGEFSFDVPANQSVFVLNFKPGNNEKITRFNVDVTEMIKNAFNKNN